MARETKDLEQWMKETPRAKWPLFLKEAAERARATGRTVQQVLDEDRKHLRSLPDEGDTTQ